MTAIFTAPIETPAFSGSIHKLSNGLTAVLHQIPTAAAVTCDIWIRSGARTEPVALSGVSHFLEHMIFKGTEKFGPGVFDAQIENRGGVTNAATSQDYTHYYITVANEHFPATFPYLAELVVHAAVPPEEYERERLVVLEEIRRSQDSPDRQAYELLSRAMYPDHPYGRPVLGTPESLMAMSADQMRAFHRERYHPGNATVVIVGGVSEAEMLRVVEDNFGTFVATGPSEFADVPKPARPAGAIYTHHLGRLEQPRLMMAWMGAPIDQIEEAIALEVLAAVLSEGRTSRLVRSLREEQGLVRSVHAYFMPQKHPGLFVVVAQADAEHLDAVEAQIRAAVAELGQAAISPEEHARAVRMLRNDYIFGTESPSQLAGLYGYYSTLADIELVMDYPRMLQQIDGDALQQAARTYLDPERAVVLRLLPDSEAE